MEDQPRMHGPVTDGRIAYALDKLKKRKRGYLQEAILLLEAIQHERQQIRDVASLVASPRRDWPADYLRQLKQPGVYGDQG